MFRFAQHDKNLITERNVDIARGLHQLAVRRDKPEPIDCFGNRHVTYLIVLVAHHRPEMPLVRQLDGFNAETCRQNSVEGRRRAAALKMTEHAGARFFSRACCDFARHDFADPAQPKLAPSTSRFTCSPCFGLAPSAATTTVPKRPAASRELITLAILSLSNGISGIKMISAPPAMPPCNAIQPACRPITSTTMTRLWLVAVVCKRSSASTTTLTAESKPNVMAVASRSLSIVFGTPMQLMPASCNCCAVVSEPSPPTTMNA